MILGPLIFHIDVMTVPMHFWGDFNAFLMGITTCALLQSLSSVLLVLEYPLWVFGFPLLREVSKYLAYFGAISYGVSALVVFLVGITGTELLTDISVVICAYMLMLFFPTFFPSLAIIWKEATIDESTIHHKHHENTEAQDEATDQIHAEPNIPLDHLPKPPSPESEPIPELVVPEPELEVLLNPF